MSIPEVWTDVEEYGDLGVLALSEKQPKNQRKTASSPV